MIKKKNDVNRAARHEISDKTGDKRRGPDQLVVRIPPYSNGIGDIGGTGVSDTPIGGINGFPGGRTVDTTRDVVDDRQYTRTTNSIHGIKGGKSKKNNKKIKRKE
ncbi:hypothetical protein C4577_03280 [Candidatus Parcubacteria bacterium]|nr:MAG: hypothetical protein C4577_03280 [Candidatus Parcubacteria bacterium]